MQPIVKFGLTKAGIISTIHTAVMYGTCSLGGIVLFNPIMIQVAGQIAFIIENCWKPTPSCTLLLDDLSTLQLEAG